MPRLRHIAFALISISLVLSNHLYSQTKPCESKRDIKRIVRIRNPSGWDVSLVSLTSRTQGPSASSERRIDGAVESELTLRNRYFRFTKVVLHSCDDSATVLPGYLRVAHAYSISASGRTFALVLSGNCGELVKGRWIAAMCDETIALVDTTGSGEFDLLEIGEAVPDMPEWVRHPQ
jgi:hypothetical protein